MSDDVVATFCAITNASEDDAIAYLSMADFSLEEAVNAYQIAVGDRGKRETAPPQTSSHGTAPYATAPPPPAGSSGGGRGSSRSFGAHQGVSQLTEDEGMGFSAQHHPFAVMEQMQRRMMEEVMGDVGLFTGNTHGGEFGRGRGRRATNPRVEEIHDDDDDDETDTGGGPRTPSTVGEDAPMRRRSPQGGRTSPQTDAIQAIFRAPPYAARGDFADCCVAAVNSGRWVILNILRRGDFPSGCMNRDIWQHSMVASMLPEMCLLYQVLSDSSQGQLLTTTYQLTARQVPCILILHPLTKAIVYEFPIQQLVQVGGEFNVMAFLELLTNFVEAHPPDFKRIGDEMGPRRSSSWGVHEGGTHTYVESVDDEEELDEETMLQRALEESRRMATKESSHERRPEAEHLSPAPAAKNLKVDRTGDDRPAPATTQSGSVPTPPPPPSRPAPVDIDSFRVGPSTPPSDVYRLRFRLPSGQVELAVKAEIPVLLLVAHVAYLIHEANPAQFPTPPSIELRGGFPPKPLELPATGSAVSLKEWGILRPTDSVVVHIV